VLEVTLLSIASASVEPHRRGYESVIAGVPFVTSSGEARMLRLRAVRWGLPMLLFGVACTSSQVLVRGPSEQQKDADAVEGRVGTPGSLAPDGVDLVPLSVASFVFGVSVEEPEIQPPSAQLARIPGKSPRLHVKALPSGARTAAVGLVEDSPKGHRWGELITPALRRIFSSFAGDSTLGDFLVIVDDVKVLGGGDGVPMTAYRWARRDVEAYARCGIPPTGIDRCTQTFYTFPEMVLVSPHSGHAGF
jgi:hypothetical protein